MGEAKLRKLSVPNYGTAPRFQPGIIITPMIFATKDLIKIHSSDVAPDVLRHALLLYENIVFPQARKMQFSGGPEVPLLEKQGIIQKMFFGDSGLATADDLVNAYPSACREAFTYLNSKNPGCWSVTSGIDGLLLWESNQQINLSGLAATLTNAIPLPSPAMPIAEVLEFRSKRRDELRLLQDHIFHLSKHISEAESPHTELHKQILQIDKDCSTLVKISKETRFPFTLSTIKASFDLGATGKVGLGFLAGYSAGLDLTTAAVASIAANAGSIINFSFDIGVRKSSWHSSPYSYVVRAHNEFCF